jgi:putative heme iron utilization protein
MRLNTAQTEAVPFASLVPYPLVLDASELILVRREERRIAADLCEPREQTNKGCREPKAFRRPDDAEVS